MKKVYALLLTSLLLTACATAGTKFDFSQARQIGVGMTEQEVVQLMGKPMSVTARGQNQVWVWSYAKAGAFSVDSKSVSVIFQDGRVVEAPTIPDSFK